MRLNMSQRREWLRNNERAYEYNVVYTKSTHFIMPMIGYEIADFLGVDEKINHLINCYIDVDKQLIVLVLDNTKDSNIVSWLKFNKANPNFISSHVDDDDKEIVLFYSIPNKYKEDFDVFLTSKYSKMSENYKKVLVDVYGRKTNTSDYRPNQFDVIYPTSYKRRQLADHLKVNVELIDELTSKLNMEYETYKNIKDLLQTSILETNKETSNKCENQ